MKRTSLIGVCSIFLLLFWNVESLGMEHQGWINRAFEGRYTRGIKDHQVLVPRKVNEDGEFVSYSLQNFYERDTSRRRKRDLPDDSDKVHYGLTLSGVDHLVELWPNHDFMAPGLVVEERGAGSSLDINNIKIRPVKSSQCHYVGRVKGQRDSRVALSVCDGMSGYIRTNEGHYFIEPMKDHQPEDDGQHAHIVHKRSVSNHETCGTGGWEDGWRDRLRFEEHRQNRDVKTSDSTHRYLELLVVADKKFLENRNDSDVETYILTILNMAADFYHDASIGNLIDVVVVRIIYLHKEEEEKDLTITPAASKTLESFCNWQQTVNPQDLKHPNHHDIAVLLTRYDICSEGKSACGLLGLAYLAQACNPSLSCAICEDSGLELGITVAHEVGHVVGCGHDNGVDSECNPEADEVNVYVMSPYVQMATSIWSKCSRKFIQEFLDNGLGDCLLDEPQEQSYKFPNMPPGAMYDANVQCARQFHDPKAKVCTMSPDVNCKFLYCELKPGYCSSYKQPPADGTKCAPNKWCFNRKCVPLGQRPDVIHGEWSSWGQWSECTRTCGGGISFSDRDCDNPAPLNHGRYCLGQRRKYRVCNTQQCDPNAATFLEQQCSEHDNQTETYKSYVTVLPHEMCRLLCSDKNHVIRSLAPRLKDGSPCRPGTKDRCIAGKCRAVGCDWVLESDAVEDRCGVCKGDGTECTIVEETLDKAGHGYVKIATIPAGSRKISFEELKPTEHTLALKAADDKTFLLNGGYREEGDKELHIVGTIAYYFHPENDLEKIFIAGPTTEPIILYICFYSTTNLVVTYKYAVPNEGYKSNYQPKYHWEFLEWGECNRRCAGGTQESEPKCNEERDGVVSDSFCPLADKPKTNSRSCNQEPCKARWRVGQWGECSGCLFKTGHKDRTVECIRESPYEDDETITDEKECTENKPQQTELCDNTEPCKDDVNEADIPKRSIRYRKRRTSYTTPKPGVIVIDKAPPQRFHIVEVPKEKTKNNMYLSDEANEALGDQIAQAVNTKGIRFYDGD